MWLKGKIDKAQFIHKYNSIHPQKLFPTQILKDPCTWLQRILTTMFGFSLRSFAEAAINTLTGASQGDEELANLIKEAEKLEASFRYEIYSLSQWWSCSNITSISKELEKQLVSFADTNSTILKHVDHLRDGKGGKGLNVDVWGKASRFYYSVGAVKETLYPELVRVFLLSFIEEWESFENSFRDYRTERIALWSAGPCFYVQQEAVVDCWCPFSRFPLYVGWGLAKAVVFAGRAHCFLWWRSSRDGYADQRASSEGFCCMSNSHILVEWVNWAG